MVPTHDTIYSGMLANVQVTMFTFDTPTSKGVSFGLDAIQVVDNMNTARWDNQANPADGFAPLDPLDPLDPDDTDGRLKKPAAAAAAVVEDDDIPW